MCKKNGFQERAEHFVDKGSGTLMTSLYHVYEDNAKSWDTCI